MKTQYDVEIIRGVRHETIDLSMFSYVTDIIKEDEHFFFNIVMQGGVTFSSMGDNKDELAERRKKVLKARDKFLNRFYKHMAKLNNTTKTIKKDAKQRKKYIKEEIGLLNKIYSVLLDIHYTRGVLK